MTWKLYIPDGAQDILVSECALKRKTENAVIGVFEERGFAEIATPTMEFFDSFSGQRDIIPEENMSLLGDFKIEKIESLFLTAREMLGKS